MFWYMQYSARNVLIHMFDTMSLLQLPHNLMYQGIQSEHLARCFLCLWCLHIAYTFFYHIRDKFLFEKEWAQWSK